MIFLRRVMYVRLDALVLGRIPHTLLGLSFGPVGELNELKLESGFIGTGEAVRESVPTGKEFHDMAD